MLEIYTVLEHSTAHFDQRVNEALCSGWELTRRDVFIGPDYQPIFYAEFERVVEEEEDPDERAQWVVTRDPAQPLKCSSCGYKETRPKPVCPSCYRIMEGV